jgi:hypothetical protein
MGPATGQRRSSANVHALPTGQYARRAGQDQLKVEHPSVAERKARGKGSRENVPEEATGNQRLALLLAMAMFVLVVDTSLMNVSIASVVDDLDTTVSGGQSAIALAAVMRGRPNFS